ncbi:ATP-binding cassette domain-containing protein [Anatilimnocola floriformis]|uniref:ATP-binding cassette domain-containing protein n=1 Tax=Anatilimnocola floriformis TaxID=2948575 RepID=UPI0020C23A0C|nr:ATP-binding cassette domain-containing protein [Anatilimnocola floriformis]
MTDAEPVANYREEQIIRIGVRPTSVGRAPNCDIRLPNADISPHHVTLSRCGEGQPDLLLQDNGSQFGCFRNGERLKFGTLHLHDQLRLGNSVVYTVVELGLLPATAGSTPSGDPLSSSGMALLSHGMEIAKGGQLLLRDVTFSIPANSFVGILGPSGAGKSTLLQTLGGYLPPLAGWLEVDDVADAYADQEIHQRAVGYVAQDDVVFPNLTILENVRYAARLRYDAMPAATEYDDNVDRVLRQLDLERVANNLNYSGGQRKRLSVAIELLKRPRLLLMDEPTSGLDPAAEAELMSLLRSVSQEGTTVICTTHQLASIDRFDLLILLGVQKIGEAAARSEEPSDLRQLWDLIGFHIAPAEATSCHVGTVARVIRPAELKELIDFTSEAEIFSVLRDGLFDPATDEVPKQKPVPAPALPGESGGLSTIDLQEGFERLVASAHTSSNQLYFLASDATVWKQVRILLERFFIGVSRDRGFLTSLVVQPVALSALMVLSQFRSSADASVAFFLVVISIWLGMNNSVRDLIRERKTYVREKLAGLSPPTYYLSRAVSHAFLGAVQVTLLLLVTGILGKLLFSVDTWERLGLVGRFPWLWFVLFCCHFGGVGLGLMVSALSRSEETAVGWLPVLIMPQLLLSAVATGQADAPYSQPRPFRPFVKLMESGAYESTAARVADGLSLLCLSRPGALLAESPKRWVWVGDLTHLTLLLIAIWAAGIGVFLRRQREWHRELGLG